MKKTVSYDWVKEKLDAQDELIDAQGKLIDALATKTDLLSDMTMTIIKIIKIDNPA